jgi:hypothetical protein
MKALLKASALALILLTTACTDKAQTVTAPQATGVAKATAALQGRQSRIDQALRDAGA